jgi:multidrug efflux pump
VIGGMLTATLLGVIFVPIFFVWVLSLVQRKRGKSSPAANAAPRTVQE